MPQTQPKSSAPKKTRPESCQTLDLGLDGFRECLQVGPTTCKHAVPFGYAFLCRQGTQTASRSKKRQTPVYREAP